MTLPCEIALSIFAAADGRGLGVAARANRRFAVAMMRAVLAAHCMRRRVVLSSTLSISSRSARFRHCSCSRPTTAVLEFAVVAADVLQRLLGGVDGLDQIVDLGVEEVSRDLAARPVREKICCYGRTMAGIRFFR